MKASARVILSTCLALTGADAFAQGKTDYALNDGQVKFHVPASWTAIMEKSDGNPQAVAFQAPDPVAQGSNDSATVTVKTRKLRGSAEFAGVVQDEFERSKSQPGYESDTSNKDNSVSQYFVQRALTRYLVRDHYYLTGDIAVEIRCTRPLLDKTPPTWNAEFDRACDSVLASLKK